MRCPICDATAGFSPTEYVVRSESGTTRAPALECLACRAIVLRENAAHTHKELASVRLAQAARARSIS